MSVGKGASPRKTSRLSGGGREKARRATRLAVQKGAAIPLQLAQCTPLDLKIVNDIMSGRR